MSWRLNMTLALLLALAPGATLRGQTPAVTGANGAEIRDAVNANSALGGSLLRVWHQPPPPPSSESDWLPRPIQLSAGEVISFDNQRVKLEASDQQAPLVISLDRVVWLEASYESELAKRGMRLFADGKYAEAISPLLEAIRQGPPIWQQQWLIGHLAIAATEAERFPAALELVKQLQQSQPPIPAYCLLPVRWHSRPSSPQAISAARKVIGSEATAVRLVAASWLLSSPSDRLVAERVLEALAADRREPALARLAEVVSWRRTPVPQIASVSANWPQLVERLPISLQGGPLLTTADRLEAAGEQARSREFYLSVALLHQHPNTLARYASETLEQMKP
ncbi:hypothetical protein SH139x_005044 [Planctomycetaceae bacterium SH139]